MSKQQIDQRQVDRAIAWYADNRDRIGQRLESGPWTIGEITFQSPQALVLLDERIERMQRSQKDPALLEDLYILKPIRFFYRGLHRPEGG